MLPDPLHAAVVHFPIVFAVLLPIAAVISLLAIRRGGRILHWWGFTVLVMLALTVSSFVATRTGEAQEDRVERVVGEQPLHAHEEAGERFLMLTGVLLATGLAGFIPRRVGWTLRVASTLATVGVLAAGWQVGHTGGELVYRHGAASAYVTATGAGVGSEARVSGTDPEGEERLERRRD